MGILGNLIVVEVDYDADSDAHLYLDAKPPRR